jgi:hypothetical protein
MNRETVKRINATQKASQQWQRWQVNNEYTPFVYLSLWIGDDVPITSAITVLSWNVEVFNSSLSDVTQVPFVWSGTSIRIPLNGYYTASLSLFHDIPGFSIIYTLYVNGIAVATSNDNDSQYASSAMFVRYFDADDTVEIGLSTPLYGTIQSRPFNQIWESPILHIRML